MKLAFKQERSKPSTSLVGKSQIINQKITEKGFTGAKNSKINFLKVLANQIYYINKIQKEPLIKKLDNY